MQYVTYDVGMIKINFNIPSPLLAELRAVAARMDMSVAEIIRRALEAYLRK